MRARGWTIAALSGWGCPTELFGLDKRQIGCEKVGIGTMGLGLSDSGLMRFWYSGIGILS